MADATPQAPLSSETEVPPTCFNCGKTASELQKSLLKCSKCTTRYCSAECQKNDWNNNNHKTRCAPRNPKKPAATSQHTPGFASVNSLLGLGNDDYLHTMSERDVFGQLIDSFRLRAEDEMMYAGKFGAVYDGQDPQPEFKGFLDLAESREKILPSWWNAEKRVLCERMATGDAWYNIYQIVEKSDIMEHYGDNLMPMKLRVLAEKIYGKGFM